eukprot:scaffold2107_cov192-Alexandrium_tamarense.AAC.51
MRIVSMKQMMDVRMIRLHDRSSVGVSSWSSLVTRGCSSEFIASVVRWIVLAYSVVSLEHFGSAQNYCSRRRRLSFVRCRQVVEG